MPVADGVGKLPALRCARGKELMPAGRCVAGTVEVDADIDINAGVVSDATTLFQRNEFVGVTRHNYVHVRA